MLRRRMAPFFSGENTIWINAALCIISCMISFVYICAEWHLALKVIVASVHLFVIHKCITKFATNVDVTIDFAKKDYYLNAYSEKKMLLSWIRYSWSLIVFPIISVVMEVILTQLSWFSGIGKILFSVSLSYMLFLENGVGYMVTNHGVFKRGTFRFLLVAVVEYMLYYALSVRVLFF